MKIRSEVDVITNSSTEIFTLRTDKTLSEVSEWLHKNTSGFREPEIMNLEDEDGVLQELIEFGYVVNPQDEESRTYHLLKAISTTTCYDEHYNTIKIEHAVPLFKAWLEHLWLNKAELARFMRKKYAPEHWKIRDGVLWEEYTDHDEFVTKFMRGAYDYELHDSESYPPGFVDAFLSSWSPRPLPKTLEIPERLNANYWVGKIGFSGTEDNSIPYEDFDKIRETFDGNNWHMG